ncbi:glycosyltransferase family 66 protein [Tortispora caseinolytica NRRL Y-17796]|uniref:Dolichyl-diphosphooligosaccharide--protein glycosyltransferase subunit STT3 n=1 Tax=Tortispora caseinolytica NRRL Y-17796 TaxID=767744 RepID=A0A1E4TIM1_9ASCO|nr:glycosyltransferase family 66 protein [Tortispora caseinolytica NRRL Y-17796]
MEKETKRVFDVFRAVILLVVGMTAIAARLFSVVRFESIIHEFDPWFNFRATKYLVANGYYKFLNWFDDRTWYPLGRVTGGTLYPGLMVTSGLLHTIFRWLSFPVDIRNICVMLAPGFSALTAIATYLLASEMKNSTAGLYAAAFMGIAPGYISRSVAGSYDNEAIAIFLLMFTFYLWIKSVKVGSVFYGTMTALFYFYMVAAWGGYAFITNMIPLHVFVLCLMGRFSHRIYIAYSSWYALGTLASMQIPFVGFLPIRSSEHMAALGVFGLVQLLAFGMYMRSMISSTNFRYLLFATVGVILIVGFAGIVLLTISGVIAPWGGRFYSFWDTNYARIHIPIIASVAEHQPTAWPMFFFDTHMLVWLAPAGMFFLFSELRDEHVFVIVYAVLGSYFAGVMVRLMLTLTPILCVAGAVAVTTVLEPYLNGDMTEPARAPEPKGSFYKRFSRILDLSAPRYIYQKGIRLLTSMVIGYMLLHFVFHCTWVTQNAYSSPSVVLASARPDGSTFLIDDYREAYYWLRQNTDYNAKVMSWWDYGYQIGGMADRTTLVDNNTWNNTHIATVGKAMSSSEEVAYPILLQHDVDYILVVFGGLIGYSGDDINKFLWMVRISSGIWPDEIQEKNYFTPRGEYKVDAEASPAMRNSLMYKMSYYRFADLLGRNAIDRQRQQLIPNTPIVLDTLEEVFTSENWMIRIYQVKKPDVFGRTPKEARQWKSGIKRTA